MTQATIAIANGSGAAVRAAVNSALEAMTTKQSGSSAPSPTYPFMEWADTGNDLLKQRNAANSAWIIKGTLSAAYGGLPASAISYAPGSPALLEATDVQAAIDELAAESITPASQAEQAAATDNDVSVTPANQQWHPSAVQAAVQFGDGGAITVNSSYNIASVDDLGTGNYRPNIANDFAAATYRVVANADRTLASTTSVEGMQVVTQAVGSFDHLWVTAVPTATNQAWVSMLFSGALA
jgi:hypothetical protein